MSLHRPNTTCYSQIQQNRIGTGERNRYGICFLLLAVMVGTETLITATILYRFTCDLHTTEALSHNDFPIECLRQHTGPEGPTSVHGPDSASCDLLIWELQNVARKRLLLDVQNSLWQGLGEHNVTRSSRLAVHAGAKPDPQHQSRAAPGDASLTLERLNWVAQGPEPGLMRLTDDGEIAVPRDGIYFVYSQVQFESSRLHPQLTHWLFKRTASHSGLQTLARAGEGPHLNSGVGLYASQQGALFRLNKGDRLSLYVSDMGAVRFPPEGTYFGAFMIE